MPISPDEVADVASIADPAEQQRCREFMALTDQRLKEDGPILQHVLEVPRGLLRANNVRSIYKKAYEDLGWTVYFNNSTDPTAATLIRKTQRAAS